MLRGLCRKKYTEESSNQKSEEPSEERNTDTRKAKNLRVLQQQIRVNQQKQNLLQRCMCIKNEAEGEVNSD